MLFTNRQEAGQKLAVMLEPYSQSDPLILALPRGGVPVGLEIARHLNAPLDVLVVRKLGVPGHAEFGFGAIAPGNIRVLDDRVMETLKISKKMVENIARIERQELDRRLRVYRDDKPQPKVLGKTIIIVDDGLATGVTIKAASLRMTQKKSWLPSPFVIKKHIMTYGSL